MNPNDERRAERLAELLARCFLEIGGELPIDLDALCGGDPELRSSVQRLLRQRMDPQDSEAFPANLDPR